MPSTPKKDLQTILLSIRERLSSGTDSLQSLRSPATPQLLQRLSSLVCPTDALPQDLETWFRLHDGQEAIGGGIDPDAPAFRWMSVQGAIDAWQFLSDENEEVLQPWSKDWLPISENGGGDHVFVVLRGQYAGKLKFYYHDDKARPTAAASLLAFAEGVDRRLRSRQKALAKRKALPEFVSDDGCDWQDVDAPTLEELEAAPIGTAFYTRSLPYQSYWYRVRVKVAKEMWIEGNAQSETHRDDSYVTAGALADIERRLREQTPRDWKLTSAQLVEKLSDKSIFRSGLLALDGAPARGNPYFVRRRTVLKLRASSS